MGKPAARLGDMHQCPAYSGKAAHSGGPITGPGCPTILIGGMPAAVMTDLCVCNGPPDTIVKGSTGVFFGGKPAARMGDQCAHGGKIVVGCPTVLIGDNAGGMPLAILLDMVKVVPQLSQQIAMKQAAETGAPFCEKCDVAAMGGANGASSSSSSSMTGAGGASSFLASDNKTSAGNTDNANVQNDKKHWVKFVVQDETGKPVANVKMKVTLPDNSTVEITSDENGMIEIKNIDSGNCKIEPSWKEHTAAEMVFIK